MKAKISVIANGDVIAINGNGVMKISAMYQLMA